MRLKCPSARPLPEGERRRRKHQKRRGAALRRHACKPRRLDAAVGPDAIDQRQFGADLLLRNLEYTPLFVEGARADLRRMRVNGNRRKPFDRRHVAQMLAEALFVDREIVVEGQQHRRDYAVRDVVRVPWHRACQMKCFRGDFVEMFIVDNILFGRLF